MTHIIYYTLTGLFIIISAVIITPNFTVLQFITSLIEQYKINYIYTYLLSIAILGVSCFIGGTLAYLIFGKEGYK